MSEKKILSFWWMFIFCMNTKQAKKNSVGLSVCLAVRTWNFAVDTITFEGVSGSEQNLVGVFYVWNVGLVLKSKLNHDPDLEQDFDFDKNFAERHQIWWVSLEHEA